MAEIDERVVNTQNGVVDADAEYDDFDEFWRVKSDEEVRDIILLGLVEQLDGKIDVHKVVLVGRYAAGCAWKWDDIEIGVVSPDFEGLNSHESSRLIYDNIDIHKLDPFVVIYGFFTPDEFLNGQIASLYGWNWRGGKVIYEKGAN